MYRNHRFVAALGPALLPAALLVAAHLAAAPAAAQPAINEVVRDHVGVDTSEFVEIFGDPSTDYSAWSLLEIEGDSAGAGVIDDVWVVGTTDAAGIWFTGYLSSRIENGTVTLLLVEGFSGLAGDDLDTDNDGVLDATPWSTLADDVGLSDAGGGDQVYSTTVLAPGFDGSPFTPGGASRFPDGADTDTPSDWVRNDFDGEGLPGFTGTPEPGEALNTGGLPNLLVDDPPPADVTICEIQGSGDLSPLAGQVVTTLDNIVTVVAIDGFFLQTPTACDGDPATSDGIFVFSDPPAVLPGDQVDVTGTVDEFFDRTELTGVTVTVDSSGHPIPAPVVFDANTPDAAGPRQQGAVRRDARRLDERRRHRSPATVSATPPWWRRRLRSSASRASSSPVYRASRCGTAIRRGSRWTRTAPGCRTSTCSAARRSSRPTERSTSRSATTWSARVC